jgi:hypothetical protein
MDNLACISAFFYEKLYGKSRNIDILISAKSTEVMAKATDEVIMTLRRERNLKG